MLHYIHQLISTSICLLLGAEQEVNSGVLELLAEKELPGTPENDAMTATGVNQNTD